MLHKTEGIVLSITRYSDKYSVAQVFTPQFGRVAYLVPLSKSRKGKINQALFFPLSILELEVEHFPLREIHRLKDVQRHIPLYSINVNMTKLSVAFFLSEFLTKILQETQENRSVFDFVKNSILELEKKEQGLANFHLAFTFRLALFLGITPNLENYQKNSYFDLLSGEFTTIKPLHNHCLTPDHSLFLDHFKRVNYHNMHLYKLSQHDRNTIINYMLDYYRIHVYDFSEIKSLEVLRELH